MQNGAGARRAARLATLAAGLAISAVAIALAAPVAAPPRRLVLVSFDGAGGLDVARREAAGQFSPDGFARARREGFSADRLETVTPSLTSVSHASISSGALPSLTGVVGNWFRPRGGRNGERVSGFDVESGVETLWEAARRQGKRIASLAWPGVLRADASVGIRYASEFAKHGHVFRASPVASGPDAAPPILPPELVSFSPPRGFDLLLEPGRAAEPRLAVRAVALDSTDDGRRDYDEIVVLGTDSSVRARARAGTWFALSERAPERDGERDVLRGRWLKLLSLAPDLAEVVVYVGPDGRTRAEPEDFRRTLDRRAGFWPGPPDDDLLSGPNPDVATFVEQAARFTQYFMDAFDVADERGDWDLLLAYQPVVDQALHALDLVSPDQPGYTPDRAARFAAGLREVWRANDRAAARYLRFLGRGDVAFVSDHGMRAMTRAFFVAEYLKRRGFVTTESGGNGRLRVAPGSAVDVAAGGGTAHVYVNRASLPGGVVRPADVPALVSRLAVALREAMDDAGKPVFETVASGAELGPLGLASPNSGDLVVIAAGPTALRGGFGTLWGTADTPGQHGFGPDPELDGLFFHAGDGIAPGRVPTFSSLDVAARVAARLGIKPPGTAR